MNEEALNDSFNLFAKNGYNGTIEDYQELIRTEKDALNDSYNLFKGNGYSGSASDFSSLIGMGPAKTNDSASADPAVESNQNDTDSQSGDGSLGSQPELTTWQSVKNSLSNLGENFDDVREFWSDDGGKDAAKDIATNAIYSTIFGQKNLENKDAFIGGDIGSKNTLDAIERYEKDQGEVKATKGLIKSYEDGDWGGVLAGTVNAVTNGFGSMVYGVGTGFMGYMADFTARNYTEYNKQKADNLGVSLEELIEGGEAETFVPVALGTTNMVAEVIGDVIVAAAVVGTRGKVKGPAAFALRKLPKRLLNKIMYNKKAKAALTLFGTAAGEFATEITQHGVDEINDELGRVAGTEEEADVIGTFYDAVTSEEGLEAGLQGALGAGGMVGGSYSIKAMNSVRESIDGDLLDKNLSALSVKQLEFNKATDPIVKEGIQVEIDNIEESIANQVVRGNKIYNSLNNGQISELESLSDLQDAAAFKITELNKKKRLNQISEVEYNIAKQGFESQYSNAKQGIQDMNLAKNIDFLKDTIKNEGFAKDIEANILNSTLETEAAMENLSEVDKKSKQEYFDDSGVTAGFTVGGKIFINKEAARNTGQINVGKHEFLHKIINAKVGGIEAQAKMVKSLRRSLTSKQRKLVDKTLINRGYKSRDRFNTEYVQVLSDLITTEKISFEKSSLGKMGDAFKRFFVGNGFEKISFKDGRGVLNFVKDYSKNTKELSAEAKEAVGNTNLATEGSLQFSKTVEQAEADLENAQNADPNDPRYFDNLDAAEAALDAAEDAALNPVAETVAKPKPAPKVKKERPAKPTRTTDLGPRDPLSQKIMDAYNVGMYGIERPEYKASKPLPAPVERKLVPMFEGYINTIVQQKFKQFATEALEFQDALSILRAEVVSAIRTYNPAKNKDLAGYVKKIIQTRQSLMFKEANTEFTSNLDDAKGVASTQDTQSIDRSGNVERGQATFDELDIVDDALIEDIKTDLEKEIRVRTQKGTLSEMISVKKGREVYMVTWLENYVNKQLFKKLSKKLGAITGVYPNAVIPGTYIDFLNDPKTFDIITKALPIKSIKKSYGKLFPIERVARELTAEGNPVFRIKAIDKKTFLTYFVKGKKSAVLERQKQLFREILTPLAKQVVADFATPENITSLEDIKSLAPETALDVTQEIVVKAQLENLESKLDRYKGEQAGFDIIQFSKEGSLIKYDSTQVTSTNVKNALNFDPHSEEFLSLNESLQHATNWVRETLKLKGATLGGIIYEMLAIERISSSAKTLGIDLKVKTLRGEQAGFDSNRPDIELTVKNENVPVELKQSVYARFGQTTLGIEFAEDGTKFIVRSKRKNADGSKKSMTFEDIPTGKKLKGAMEKSEVHLKAILKQINKIEKTEFNSFPLGKSIKISTVEKIKKSKAYRALAKISTDADGQTVSDHYNAKDTHVLQIGGGKGLFLLGDDVYNLNGSLGNTQDLVPNIGSLEFKGVMRLKFNYNRKAGTSSLSLISEPQIKDKKSVAKSPINLDSKRGVAAFYNRFNQIQKSKTPDQNLNKARAEVNLPEHPIRGISVWDFDDTLATTKSNVLYTMPDGTKGKMNATEFALDSDKLSEAGAKFDFSEFEKVMKGKKGPMFEKAVARNKKFGNSNVYILTARPANAKYAIHEFLKGIGLNIKLNNIVGLGDGTAIAKARWVVGKVAEGYNDFYFADDAYKNVAAVQSVLKEADVKSKVHQAKMQFSKDLNSKFNDILEDATGISSKDVILEGRARIKGEKKGRFNFFIPPSAEDFQGLMYKLTGQGKVGENQQAWFKEALFDPFAKGIRDFESYKQNATGIVNNLKKSLKDIPAGLNKINETGYTNEVAARVILWRKNGHTVPGLDKSEVGALIRIVQTNPDLLAFVKQMDKALGGYPAPQNDWLAGTLTTDAINMINTTKRSEFLQEWKANVDLIFSKENMNKLEAGFGKSYVEALEDMLYRMDTGRNRPSGKNKQTNQFMNWVNDSVGTIMFFNTRSALLQLLSTVNFINWGDNNPALAAKAFANQDQFWKDFAMLFNSDFLKQRRSGLKNDVNADDIANAAATATNKTRAVLSSLLKVGFLPTQMADSFAIAMGGASFIRNRINTYTDQGMSKAAAEERAFLDFQEIAEETQQSSRPDRVSQQQASPLGRIILAFANTPMQYMRLTKKAVLDLKNGRGDVKTNITKILYYTFVQNVIFSGLQSALFAAAFEDEDEETIDNKQLRTVNSMTDSVLRGTGVYGAIVATLKNIVLEINKQSNKDRPDYTQASLKMLSISPPIDSKIRKALAIGRAFSYKSVREKMFKGGLDDPALYAFGQGVSALFNIPLDRAIRKADNVRAALSNDTKYWQKVALLLGWSQWDLGLIETSSSKKKGFGGTSKWKKSGSNKKWKK